MQLIQVLYINHRRGSVDDITLDELIRSAKISHFYRPAEERWVDVFVDPVRGKGQRHGAKDLKRRYADREVDDQQKQREGISGGLLRKVFIRDKKRSSRQSAGEWFERGFIMLRLTNYTGAARAFARSIQLDPVYQQAYIHRGLAYDALGNFPQAIEDYSMAIAPNNPQHGEAYYLRGLAFGRLGMTMEAIADLRSAADRQHPPACRLFASHTELRKTLGPPTEPLREEKVGDAITEALPEVPGDFPNPIDKQTKGMTQLEAQSRELEQIHDILAEAARLLEEEGLTTHKTLNEKLSDASEEKTRIQVNSNSQEGR